MKHVSVALLAALLLGSVAGITNVTAQGLAELKGRTYICFLEGKFDSYPNFASAFKISFDSAGYTGKTRGFSAYEPNTPKADQGSSTFTFALMADGRKYFGVKNENGGDQGSFIFTSFDNGARLWIHHTIPDRHLEGWMLLLPPAPGGLK